jgi:hypothetical protein
MFTSNVEIEIISTVALAMISSEHPDVFYRKIDSTWIDVPPPMNSSLS